MELFSWVIANADGIFAALAAVHVAAVAIVNLTPTPSDDAFVAKVYRWIEVAAGIIGSKAKQ